MKLIKVDAQYPLREKIEEAAQVIAAGGLVAFPTETVYGLGADVFNPSAVARVFAVKNRPLNQPLIIAPSSRAEIYRLVKKIPATAKKLIDKFFPGPLTLVLLKSEIVPDIITAGKPVVAFRIPDHPVVLALLSAVKRPLTATSANRTGQPSPTDAQQVAESLRGTASGSSSTDLILDAGPTKFGIESTILDLTDKPTILRIGAVSKDAIEAVIGPVQVFQKKSD
jgi:L-threonylcarbamoyladenylate synthase